MPPNTIDRSSFLFRTIQLVYSQLRYTSPRVATETRPTRNSILSDNLIRKLPTKVELQKASTDYHITKENLFTVRSSGHPSTDAYNQTQLNTLEAGFKASCDSPCIDLAHAWHMRHNHILPTNSTKGIRIRITWRLSIFLILPDFVEQGVDGISLQGQSA
jgi:hypothetical protein